MSDDSQRDAPDTGRPLPEEWLEVARAYHRPPETPTEEMWQAVQAELASGEGDAADGGGAIASPASGGAASTVDLDAERRRRRGRALRWFVPAAAAAALVAVGVGIGRMTAPEAGPVGGPAMAATEDAAGTSSAQSSAVRAVTLDHLGRSESLLAMVRADARTGRLEGNLGRWAGALLGETRLLLDSSAADDPAVRELLQDLELILAQVAILREAGGMDADRARSELQIIARGLEARDVMSRIDAVLPAGAQTGPAALTGMTGI